MPAKKTKLSLIFFVVMTLLLVGLVPLVLTGWFLSEKSGRELRSSENRYQIQLVQEKARQIEIFGGRMNAVVKGIATGVQLSNGGSVLGSSEMETLLGSELKENPDLLAIYISSGTSEPLSVFRAGLKREQVEVIANLQNEPSSMQGEVLAGVPQRVGAAGEFVMPFVTEVAVPNSGKAKIVAIASLTDISQGIVGMNQAKDAELWDAGLPIVFVVDKNGEAIFHSDPEIASKRKPMADLRIVQEWLESGMQVQSALAPFKAVHDGTTYSMIGAYSTARLADGSSVGVISMQDEARALASVGEMRQQTWIISLAFAVIAVAVGFVLSRYMTSPIMRLVGAAKQIAEGDYSRRVDTRNITEVGTLAETFNTMSGKIEEQIANLAKAAEENRELFVGTVKALAAAIDGKDKYTRGHSERVSRISVAIGKRMDMAAEELETLRISALLHDVGKIAIDDNILKKPAALTEAEFEIMKTHPMRGYKIMSQIPAMKEFLPGMYMHHEMVNGKGYPQGLTSDEIPLQAKIVSVADTFDAMTIDRPYQKGMELGAALERLRSFVGTRYQSDVVEALIEACNNGEVANGIIRQMAEKRAAEAEAEAAQEEDDILELVA